MTNPFSAGHWVEEEPHYRASVDGLEVTNPFSAGHWVEATATPEPPSPSAE